jgi:hypothetical protein
MCLFMLFGGDRIHWGNDNGSHGKAINIAGKDKEGWLSYFEDVEEVEMERTPRLTSGSHVILDISPKAWINGGYRGCDPEIVSVGVIVPAQNQRHFPGEKDFEVVL